jgi:hypothetical protein
MLKGNLSRQCFPGASTMKAVAPDTPAKGEFRMGNDFQGLPLMLKGG